MRGTLRLIPSHRLTTILNPKPLFGHDETAIPQECRPSALAHPSVTPTPKHARFRASSVVVKCSRRDRWGSINFAESVSSRKGPAWTRYGGLGQVRLRHEQTLVRKSMQTVSTAELSICLQEAKIEIQPKDIYTWEGLCAVMQSKHGADGVWIVFESLSEAGDLFLLRDDHAELLRNKILDAALSTESRLIALFSAAHQLSTQAEYKWPDLYMKVIHFFLERGNYDEAIRWHLQLAPNFLPAIHAFGTLLASFVTNPSPQMQSTMTTLYVSSSIHKFYDYLIPPLYTSGQSNLARTWRKKLLLFKDFPSTTRSRSFLLFLAGYFPSIKLTEMELQVLGIDRRRLTLPSDGIASSNETDIPRGIYSDSLVANWFASTWTSVEFAISLLHRLGIRRIGPRSLQSLALRASDSKEVVTWLAELGKLGIDISPQKYCKILVSFARSGEDELLMDLIHCDIHPDEFEDVETRQLLMAEAARAGDWKTERLFQGIEWQIETGPTSRRLNIMLRTELSKRNLVKAKAVLDRMEALDIDMAQDSAAKLLRRVFWGLDSHPQHRSRRPLPKEQKSQNSNHPILDRAIDVTRRIAYHDVAIPVQYWKLLLYNLGRSGRLDELEQLAVEVAKLYSPPYAGLIPVHRGDLPYKSINEKEYIPADLPFVHHLHPVRKLFDIALQRSIVRWGFDQSLGVKSKPATSPDTNFVSFVDFDVARGVRLLAILRDQGVLVDTQVLRSTILSRMTMALVPGRQKHRSRDSLELSVENMKSLVDEAWGTSFLPDVSDIVQELPTQRAKLWARYPRLFAKSYEDPSIDTDFTKTPYR